MKAVSGTEMEIMEYLWSQEEPIATVDLLAYFNSEKLKGWKLQTISTFLSRLVEKGMVNSVNTGRRTIHNPIVTLDEYNKLKAKNILELMYEGSIKNFFAALYGDKKLSKAEIDDLRQWLSER